MGVWDGGMAGEHTDSGLGHEKTRQGRRQREGAGERNAEREPRKEEKNVTCRRSVIRYAPTLQKNSTHCSFSSAGLVFSSNISSY